MKNSKNNYWLGGILALAGAILGLGLHIFFFIDWYHPMIDAQLAQYPALFNYKVITYLLPVFTDFGILAGILYAVSAYGFFNKSSWAYATATIANVFALQFSFWPMIPALDTGMTPVYLFIFLPNAGIYLLLHMFVGKRSFGQLILGLMTGMTLVMAYINGTACLNLIWKTATSPMGTDPFFVLSNRMHWIVALSFGIITVGIILFSQKEWLRMLGLGMSILEIAIGIPMGIRTTLEKGEFSMFLAAPIACAILLSVFASRKLWNKILKVDEHPSTKSWQIYQKNKESPPPIEVYPVSP